MLGRQTSVAEMVGWAEEEDERGSFPAVQIIPHKQSLGSTFPFPLWILLKCVRVQGGGVAAGVFHLCSAALSCQKQDFKGPGVKIPRSPLTRLPRGLHNLLELIS